jgi:alpha-1,2-mannosyltransferase
VTDGSARRVAVVAVLTVAAAAFAAVFSARHGFFDLRVYRGAVDYWVHDGGMLYDYVNPNTRYGFTYPTFAALTMLPMAFLPWWLTMTVSVAATAVVTVVLMWRLLAPMAARHGWTPWFVVAVAVALLIAFEPMRETVTFGQVNILLLGLVAADLLWGLPNGRAWAGVGIGLATAVKLTPGIFIVYLLVTRRYRAALVASGTAAAATLLAAAVAPAASREFWTVALWDTDRVGNLAFVSNQSLRGLVARLDAPSWLWIVLVLAVVAFWAWRVRAASYPTGLALTGVLGCLVSPVTWVHHLVWLIPALVLLVDRAVGPPRRPALLALAVVAYGVLCSRVVWLWFDGGVHGFDGFLGANAYVLTSLALLLFLPVRSADDGGVPDLLERDRVPATG